MSGDGSGSAAHLRAEFDSSFARAPDRERQAGIELAIVLVAGERHALRLSDLAGLHGRASIGPAPSLVPEFIGLVGLRGGIVPVYDLGLLLGRTAAALPWLAETREPRVALAVEGFGGQVQTTAEAMVSTAGGSPLIAGYARLAEGAVPVIDMQRLLDGVLQRAAAASNREL